MLNVFATIANFTTFWYSSLGKWPHSADRQESSIEASVSLCFDMLLVMSLIPGKKEAVRL